MRMIELSEEKARVLAAYLAPKWAYLAIRLSATNAPVNTPWRTIRETMESRTFKARVKRFRAIERSVATVLEGLGATLPDFDRSAFVRPYKSPGAPARSRPREMWVSGKAETEANRLAAVVLESMKPDSASG